MQKAWRLFLFRLMGIEASHVSHETIIKTIHKTKFSKIFFNRLITNDLTFFNLLKVSQNG